MFVKHRCVILESISSAMMYPPHSKEQVFCIFECHYENVDIPFSETQHQWPLKQLATMVPTGWNGFAHSETLLLSWPCPHWPPIPPKGHSAPKTTRNFCWNVLSRRFFQLLSSPSTTRNHHKFNELKISCMYHAQKPLPKIHHHCFYIKTFHHVISCQPITRIPDSVVSQFR